MKDLDLLSLYNGLPGSVVPYQIEVDAGGTLRFRFMGAGCKELLGYEAAEVLADAGVAYGRMPPEDLAEFARKADLAARTGQAFDHVCRHRDGSGALRRIRLLSQPQAQPDGSCLFNGIMIESIEGGEAPEISSSSPSSLSHPSPPPPHDHQQLLALGGLASGIAHDFNNLLMGMLSYVGLAEAATRENPTAHKQLDRIRLGIERGRKLVQQIQLFSRKGRPAPRPLRVRRLTEDTLALLRASLPPSIHFDLQAPEALQILADGDHVRRLIVNLVTNGAQAMSDSGGRIRVIWQIDESAPPGEGGFADLIVEDEGVGIEEGMLERIFEPYVTSHEEEGASGLGLTIVRGLAQAYGSEVEIDSELGRGTRVRLRLPAGFHRPATATTNEVSRSRNLEDIHGTERILLVDDEELILDGLKKGLKRLGYRVDTCPDAEEASRRLEANPDGWELVVTDMALPGASGADLLARMRRQGSTLPFIAITGYHEKIHGGDPVGEGFADYLKKPFDYRKLGRSIRNVLDQDEATSCAKVWQTLSTPSTPISG